jgi:iron complex transport system substrate-binding protein
MLCILGLGEQLVGVSHECDYPASVAELPRVTKSLIARDTPSRTIDDHLRERVRQNRALYALDMQVLVELQPDLIVTQTLCDVCAVAEEEVRAAACRLPHGPRIVNLEPTSLEGVFECFRVLGEETDCMAHATREVALMRGRIRAVTTRSKKTSAATRVVLLEWIDPPFSCGHWNPELVALAGGREVIGIAGQPTRTIEWQEVLDAQPEVLLAACCGFDIDRTMQDLPVLCAYPGWDTLPCAQTGRVYIADGSAYFNRPGPRLVDSLELLAHALDPEVHPLPSELAATDIRRCVV